MHLKRSQCALTVGSCVSIILLAAGCSNSPRSYPEKAPLPITVLTLTESTPSSNRLYTGAVRSWKIEDIAFEVSGRVNWVVEPGMEVEGRTFRADGTLLSPGTQLAQLDEQRYQSALEAAKSSVRIETIRRDSLQVQVDESLPAEIASARSQYDLALSEVQRNERLVQQNAGSGRNLNAARADFDSAKAKLDGLNAKLLQAKADVLSAEAAIEQAIQSQNDAQRDLSDTRLYSAFPGQVAATHVVPGSLSGPNSTVATVQMMNPIKVELEISADKSRQMMQGDNITLSLTTSEDTVETVEAAVYSIAPSADNATRTFTLTLLVVNRQVRIALPEGVTGTALATTPNLWRVDLDILPDVPEGVYYMPESGMRTDAQGNYVWRVTNLSAGESSKRVLKVAKLYVSPGGIRVPFLGQAFFRTVEVLPGQEFNPAADFFATDVLVGGEPSQGWSGDRLVLGTDQRWLLRPGDLVQVDLSGQANSTGIYVPVEAINEESGRTFVYVVKGDVVEKIEVQASNIVGKSLHRITPIDESVNLAGMKIAVEGVHYLQDGQKVAIVGTSGEKS